MAKLYEPALQGMMRFRMMDMPVTPPKEKLFGNLKKYTPTSSTSTARVRMPYSRIRSDRREVGPGAAGEFRLCMAEDLSFSPYCDAHKSKICRKILHYCNAPGR